TPERARGWPRVRSAAASDRRETNAATARTADPTAAGIGPTTSSLRRLLRANARMLGTALAQLRPGASRQAKNTDEAGSVLLVVARAHGERREIGAIERKFGLAAGDVHVALVQLEGDLARHLFLGLIYESVERLAQRREPQSVVHEFGILERNLLLEVHEVALQAKRFEFAMRGEQHRAARRFIAASRLDADEAILHQIDAPDGIAAADLVQ